MIKIENTLVYNIKQALKGMRNPLESWGKSDSVFNKNDNLISLGENDKKLAINLIKAGQDHSKFLRQIFVCVDITAPLYWWKEMDQYKISTTTNSTSTMHTLCNKPLTKDDFSWDVPMTTFRINTLDYLNKRIERYNLLKKEEPRQAQRLWREIIQDLPSSFNQLRTWTGNYQNLRNIYFARENHKLEEWFIFRGWVGTLPFADDLITVNPWYIDKIKRLENEIKK